MLGLLLINSQVSSFNSFICFLPRLIILQSTMYSFWILGMHVWSLKKRYRVYSKHSLHFQSFEKLYRRAHTTHEMETRSDDWDGKPVSNSALACIHLSRILSWDNSVFFPLNLLQKERKVTAPAPAGWDPRTKKWPRFSKQLGSILAPLLTCTGLLKWSR